MVNCKKGVLLASFSLVVFFIFSQPAAAEIIGGEMAPLYNVGDLFSTSASVVAARDGTSFFTATLVCDDHEEQIYKILLPLKTGEKKDFEIAGKFDSFLLGSFKQGSCYIVYKHDNVEANTTAFEITRQVDVTLSVDGSAFAPSESVRSSGKAIKKNGMPFDGFIEVTLIELNVNYYSVLNNGKFEFNFSIPANAAPGAYTITARAYEKDSQGTVINEGGAASIINIRQIAKDFSINLNTESEVQPGDSVQYTVMLRDQSSQPIQDDISITVYKPDKYIAERKIAKSGSPVEFQTEKASPPGNWRIEAKTTTLSAIKDFYIKEYMAASFTLENDSLIITNIGNVPYNRPIEISIGDIKEVKDVSLAVGSVKRIKLVPPKTGQFPITVADGTTQKIFEGIALTGPLITTRAISLDSAKGALASKSWLAWLWVILILVLAYVAYRFYKKISKRKFVGHQPAHVKIKVNNFAKPTMPVAKYAKTKLNSVIEGNKEEATIVALNIRNLPQLQSMSTDALGTIDKAITQMKDAKAKVYADGDYRLFIFSPTLLKTENAPVMALKNAQIINQLLNAHNKRHGDTIDFGIGINIGEIIVQMREGKFNFSPLGSTVNIAKRISGYAHGDALMSDVAHRKTIGKVKAEKVGDMNVWKITKISDRTEHEDFIARFKERNKPDQEKYSFKRRTVLEKPKLESSPMADEKKVTGDAKIKTYNPGQDESADDLINPRT